MKTTTTRSKFTKAGFAMLLGMLLTTACTPAARAGSLLDYINQAPPPNPRTPASVAAVRG